MPLYSQSFADDTQLQDSVLRHNIQSSVLPLEPCFSDIQTWMLANKMKINNDKTGSLICSSYKSVPVSKPTATSVCGGKTILYKNKFTSHMTWAKNSTQYLPISLLEIHWICSVCHLFLSMIQKHLYLPLSSGKILFDLNKLKKDTASFKTYSFIILH